MVWLRMETVRMSGVNVSLPWWRFESLRVSLDDVVGQGYAEVWGCQGVKRWWIWERLRHEVLVKWDVTLCLPQVKPSLFTTLLCSKLIRTSPFILIVSYVLALYLVAFIFLLLRPLAPLPPPCLVPDSYEHYLSFSSLPGYSFSTLNSPSYPIRCYKLPPPYTRLLIPPHAPVYPGANGYLV